MKNILTALLVLLTPVFTGAAIYYVEQGSTCSLGCGLGWGNAAFPNLQDALDVAVTGDEIRVATGTYYPSKDINGVASGTKTAVFKIPTGVNITGGYPAGGGTIDWINNPTILSGNIGNQASVTDNCFNVVVLETPGNQIVNGFFIQDGNLDNTFTGSNWGGAGLMIRYGTAVVQNCQFDDNYTSYDMGGGAIFSFFSELTVENCIFNGNKATASGQIGGAIRSSEGMLIVSQCQFDDNVCLNLGGAIGTSNGYAEITESTFSNNTADAFGGAISATGGNPNELIVENSYFEGNVGVSGGAVFTDNNTEFTLKKSEFKDNFSVNLGGAINFQYNARIEDCLFYENETNGSGGAMYSENVANGVIANCLFFGNKAANVGGGQYAARTLEVMNCTYVNNTAIKGGGIYNAGDPFQKIFTNCIVWNNQATAGSGHDIYDAGGANVMVSFSWLQTYSGGFNNSIGVDPLFINQSNPYGADGLIRTMDDGLILQSGSGALDYGDNTPLLNYAIIFDFNGAPRMTPTTTDAGGYEGFAQCVVDSILYVDYTATGANNGACWTDAFRELYDAIAAVPSHPNVTTIKVAQGVYLPTANLLDRTASFAIPNNISIYGGYPNGGGTRDYQNNLTILSGDIGTGGIQTDNSYHVLKSIQNSSLTRLDGFTITLGMCDNSQSDGGAGMYMYKSELRVNNCTFTNNISEKSGGAIQTDIGWSDFYNCSFINNHATMSTDGGAIYLNQWMGSIDNCVFEENTARDGGALLIYFLSKGNVNHSSFINNSSTRWGGAIFEFNRVLVDFFQTAFIGNYAGEDGGAISSRQFGPEHKRFNVFQCVFDGNEADDKGGAIHNWDRSSPLIMNSVFYGNSSIDSGGVIYNQDTCRPEIVNSTFNANSAGSDANVIYNATGSISLLRNSILYGNLSGGANEIVDALGSYTYVVNSLSELYGTNGVNGNIVGADPLFVNQAIPKGGDGILGTSDDGLHLQSSSPCIDYASTVYIPNGLLYDLPGGVRLQGGNVDMGAYESPYGSPPAPIYPSNFNDIQAFQGCDMSLPTITKDLVTDFGAIANDGNDDTHAFVEAAYWMQNNFSTSSRLVLTIPTGQFDVGVQINYLGTYSTTNVTISNNTYVKKGVNLIDLDGVKNVSIIGTSGTHIRFKDGMYFGGYDNTLTPVSQTWQTPAPKAATMGSMLYLRECDCISVKEVELDGNADNVNLGGHYNDGYQLAYDGVVIIGSTNIEVNEVHSHDHGRDGIMVHRQEPNFPNPVDIFMYNSRFILNGRQAFSWTAGDTIRAVKCSFNKSATGSIVNRLGAGIDIEPENGICTNGYFKECEMVGSRFTQIHADRYIYSGWKVGNVRFEDCFVWGKDVSNAAWGVWAMRMRNTEFINCKIYGSLVHTGGTGPFDYIKFKGCYFSDQGPDGNPVHYASGTIINLGGGPGFNNNVDNINYDECNNVFYTFSECDFEFHYTVTMQSVRVPEYGSIWNNYYRNYRIFECNEFRYFTNSIFQSFQPYTLTNCPVSTGLWSGRFTNSNMFSNRFIDMNPIDPGGPSLPNIPWSCSTSIFFGLSLNENGTNHLNTIHPKSISGARHSRVSRQYNPDNSWGRNYADF